MTYALVRPIQATELRPSAYVVRELPGVTVVDAATWHAHYLLLRSPALSVRRVALGEHLTQLHRQWRAETRYWSSLEAKKTHPAYSSIVAMGDEAIPFILESIATHPDLLVMALHDITHEDPVAADHHGRLPDIVQDWLQWGTERGYRQ